MKKNLVNLSISSFRGISFDAEHYYGRFEVEMKDEIEIRDGKSHRISRCGYGVETHPHDRQSVTKKLTESSARALNKKDNNSFITPSFLWKPGMESTRFDSREELIQAAKEQFKNFFDDEDDLLVIETDRYSHVFDLLVGPEEIGEFLRENQDYKSQQIFFDENGYTLK